VAAELDHIALANKNHRALVRLIGEPGAHSEWIATIAFYKAVQIVEAVFARHLKIHSHSHDGRIQDLKRPLFKDLFRAFRPLFSASLVARYLEDSSARKFGGGTSSKAYASFSDYLSHDDVVKRLLKKRLNGLEQTALQFLSEPARQGLDRIQSVFDDS